MKKLDAFFLLRSATDANQSAKLSKRNLTGSVEITPDILQSLRTLEESGDLVDVWFDDVLCKVSNLPACGIARFEAHAPHGYFETLEDLIDGYPYCPPANFVLFKNEKTLVPLYHQVAELAGILADLAPNKDEMSCTLFGRTHLEIPFKYAANNLTDLSDLKKLKELLASEEGSSPDSKRMVDLYRSLFVQAVYDTVGSLSKDRRFRHLLDNFTDCMFRFRLAFRCFSDEADKAIERYEEKRAGMIAALNGVLGNIQTSLIGVPLAGLLALKEIRPAEGLTFANVIIAFSVLVVGSLLLTLSFSQGRTLDAIGEQEEQLRNEIGECGGGETKVGRLLRSMASHHSFIYKLLIAVRVLVICFIVVAVVTLFICSKAAPQAATVPSTTEGALQDEAIRN